MTNSVDVSGTNRTTQIEKKKKKKKRGVIISCNYNTNDTWRFIVMVHVTKAGVQASWFDTDMVTLEPGERRDVGQTQISKRN